MTEASYNAIERILHDSDKTTDKVEVHCSDLKKIFKELRMRRREAGILGYDNGRTIVNDIGIVPYIKKQFRKLFPDYEFDSITVTRDALRLDWDVKGVCGGIVLTANFRKEYIEDKYQIKYQLPCLTE